MASVQYVETGVDDLLRLVKEKKKLSVAEAAKHLKMHEKVVQSWIDFLIEEGVLGIEYKFITPYVYMNEHSPNKLLLQNKDTLQLKDEFFEKAKKRNLSADKTAVLWKQYVQENMDTIHEEFVKKARERNISNDRLQQLWGIYKEQLVQNI
ncbi:MAG: hypothetical protein ACMXYC_02920 [Candidatus Woesearchaeota archaeon]